jgi:hypothetical protein
MTQVTYGQLDKVLRALGFTARVLTSKPKARVYKHEETGALISLGYYADSRPVRPHHLAAVQGTLKVFGIAEPVELAAELQKAS